MPVTPNDKIPSFDEVMQDEQQPKIPSFNEVMGEKKSLSSSDLKKSMNGSVQPTSQSTSQKEPDFGLKSGRELALGQQSKSDNSDLSGMNQSLAGIDEQQHHEERAKARAEKIDNAITNTAINSLKLKGIKPTAVQLNQEKAKYKKQVDDGNAAVALNENGVPGLKRVSGFLENLKTGWEGASKAEKEADEFINNMSTQQMVDYANKQAEKINNNEYIGERPSTLGSLGEIGGSSIPVMGRAAAGAAIGAGLVMAAPETLGGSLAGLPAAVAFALNTPDMANQFAQREVLSRYSILKKQHPELSDLDLMKEAEKGKYAGGVAGVLTNAALTGTGLKTPLALESKNLIAKTLTNVGKSSLHMGSVGAGITAAQGLEREMEGVHTFGKERLDDIIKSFKENATTGALLTGLMHGVPNVVKSIFKYGLKDENINNIQDVLTANEQAGNVPEGTTDKVVKDITDYKEALSKTPSGLSPESEALIAGLIQKRTNIEKVAETKDKSPAIQDIYKEQMESLNRQISEIQRTGKPLEHEINEASGEPYKQPTYDDVQKQRVEDLADKISKGKRIEDAEDLQTQANFPDELEKQLNRISKEEKSGNKDKEKPTTELSDNIDKYFKSNEKEKAKLSNTKEETSIADEGINKDQQPAEENQPKVGSKIKWNSFGNEDMEDWTVGERRKTRGGQDAVVLSKQYVESSKDGKIYSKEFADTNGIKYDNEHTVEHLVPISEISEFINPKEESTGAKVIMPEDNTKPNIVELKKIENNETSSSSSIQKEQENGSRQSNGGTQTNNDENIASKETNGEGEAEGVGIKHAATEELRAKYKLGDYERKNATDAELEAAADDAIKKGYNPENLIAQMEAGTPPTGTENFILKKYLSTLEAAVEKNPSNENIAKVERLIKASDKIGSLQSEAFRTRKGIVPVDDSLSGFFMREKETNLYAPLTQDQKETVKNEWDNISNAKKRFDEYMAKKEADFAKKQAEEAVSKQKPKGKSTERKTHEDHVKYREKVITDIRDKLKKARGETSVIAIPYAKELIAIAPDVAKLVKDLLEEGVTKLEDIVKDIHGKLKEEIPQIQEKDVHDIIAGEYNEKKKPRNEIARQAFELKQEASLINKLDSLLKGEKPKSEKAKIKYNKQITKLREQIKSINEFDKEVKKQKDANTELAAKRNALTDKNLTKAEKELSDLEEKKVKQQQKAAEIDRKKLEKEFEQEKREEERKKIAAQIKTAKELEKELSFKTPEERALGNIKSKLQSQIDKLNEDLKTGNFANEVKKEPIKLDKEGLALKDKLIKLKQEREVRLMRLEYQNRSRYEKARDATLEVLNVPRTVMSSLDYSAPLRQAAIATVSHPTIAAKAGVEMFRQSISQQRFDRWFHDLKESPRYDLMESSKLSITDPHNHKLSVKEEAFMNNLAEKIPVIGKFIRGSERAYVGYLNKMRVDIFNQFADRLEEQGKTFENSPELYKLMAAYVNNSTGRGNLGALENYAPVLNTVFFSPRLIASRLNLLNPLYYTKLPKEIRVSALKDMGKFIGTGLTVLALAKLNGAQVEDDPRSTDFGKIKSGNTRWDIWGGFQQYVRVLTQLFSGEKKSTGKSGIKELNGKGAFGESRFDVLMRSVRGKLAPVPSMGVDFLSGRDATGQPVTLGSEAQGHLLPLLYSDLKDAMKDKGLQAIFTVGIPSTFGIGVNTYQNKPTKPHKPHLKSLPKLKPIAQ